jgi:hypothetical protein
VAGLARSTAASSAATAAATSGRNVANHAVRVESLAALIHGEPRWRTIAVLTSCTASEYDRLRRSSANRAIYHIIQRASTRLASQHVLIYLKLTTVPSGFAIMAVFLVPRTVS